MFLAAPAAAKERVAVLEFASNGVDDTLTKTVTELVAAGLGKGDRFEALSRQDVAGMLGLEKMKQVVGCTGSDCLGDASRVAGLLDVRYLVTGSIGRLGATFVLNAQLLDAQRGRVLQRAVERASGAEVLANHADRLARGLLAEPAVLQLTGQVPGATVLLDDRYVGTLPMEPLATSETGKKQLRVEGPELVPFQHEVELEAGRTTRVRLDLPRVDELEARSGLRRWIAIGAGAAGLGVAVLSGLSVVGAVEADRVYLAADPLDTTQAQLDALAADAQSKWGAGVGTGVVALGLLGVAAWLFVDDPDARKLSTGAGSGGDVRVVPTARGVAMVGRF